MAFVIGNFDSRFLPDDVKTAIGEDVPMYGVKFDGVNPAGIRTYDAATLNWTRSSNVVRGVDDFANLAPFNVKECVTKYNSSTGEREVLAYKGEAGYALALADTDADVMVEVPCFWYKRPSTWEWIVAPRAKVGFSPSPMHYRNGVLHDKVRITKYALNSNYASQTGFSPNISSDMNTFRNNLRSKGMYIMDYNTWCSLVMLMIVKYANLDVQNTVGRGRTGNSSMVACGGADDVLGMDGSATDIATDESVLTLGIENFYSNTWKYVDGIFGYDRVLYYKDVESMSSNPLDYSELLSGYDAVSTNVVGTAGGGGNAASIKSIAYDDGFDWMQFVTEVGTPNPTGDGVWSATNLNYVAVGGNYWTGYSSGLFSFCINGMAGITYKCMGALGIEF